MRSSLSAAALVAAGFLSSANAAHPLHGVATINAYPEYTGTYTEITGTVVVDDSSDGISMYGTIGGLPASVTAGVHIHAGVSCASTSK